MPTRIIDALATASVVVLAVRAGQLFEDMTHNAIMINGDFTFGWLADAAVLSYAIYFLASSRYPSKWTWKRVGVHALVFVIHWLVIEALLLMERRV